jgi:hypothetical protein
MLVDPCTIVQFLQWNTFHVRGSVNHSAILTVKYIWCSWIHASYYNSYKEIHWMFVDSCIIVQFLQWNPNKMQQCIKTLLFLILNEAQHVWSDTPPIIRDLKLHKQPLFLNNTVEGCRTRSCWTLSNNCTSDILRHYYAKSEAASTVLGSWWWAVCRPKHVELHIK